MFCMIHSKIRRDKENAILTDRKGKGKSKIVILGLTKNNRHWNVDFRLETSATVRQRYMNLYSLFIKDKDIYKYT